MVNNGGVKLRTPALIALPLTVLLAAGCGGSSTPKKQADDPVVATTAPGTKAPKPGSSPGKAGRPATKPSAGSTSGSGGATTAPTQGQPGGAPAGQAVTHTAPGTYTYDAKGTVTAGQTQDTSGAVTWTVDKAVGDRQHSAMKGEQGGGSEQDLVRRSDGTYLARLKINGGGFAKEFRPAKPVLGIPKPATAGRTWSWTMTSTDGKTKAAYSASFVKTETVTIGGTKVNTWVIQSTLKLSGDIDYTVRETGNYDTTRLIEVKKRAQGSGAFGGFTFTSDSTSTLRSLTPR